MPANVKARGEHVHSVGVARRVLPSGTALKFIVAWSAQRIQRKRCGCARCCARKNRRRDREYRQTGQLANCSGRRPEVGIEVSAVTVPVSLSIAGSAEESAGGSGIAPVQRKFTLARPFGWKRSVDRLSYPNFHYLRLGVVPAVILITAVFSVPSRPLSEHYSWIREG